MRDSIQGLQDHDLSRRQSLNQLSHPGTLGKDFLTETSPFVPTLGQATKEASVSEIFRRTALMKSSVTSFGCDFVCLLMGVLQKSLTRLNCPLSMICSRNSAE